MPPKNVARLATYRVDFPPGPMLIGLFHRPKGSVALVQGADGRMVTVAPGSRIGPAEVVAIGETSVFLVERGEERVLSLPG